MCAPLLVRTGTARPFGVIQLDTQDRIKKFTQDDLKLLLGVPARRRSRWRTPRMHETLVARAGLERDLKLAHRCSTASCPRQPPQVPGYEFFAYYESAQEVGGDYYDFIPLPDGRLGVMLGDVAGKGVPAALLDGQGQSDARFCILTEPTSARPSPAQRPDAGGRPARPLRHPGRLSCSTRPSTRSPSVNAGHMPPLVYRKAAGTIEEAHLARPRRASPWASPTASPMTRPPSPSSPATASCSSPTASPTPRTRTTRTSAWKASCNALKAGPDDRQGRRCERLVAAVKQHSAGCKQHDDITIVCFGRRTLMKWHRGHTKLP